jgi:hypothetical protein
MSDQGSHDDIWSKKFVGNFVYGKKWGIGTYHGKGHPEYGSELFFVKDQIDTSDLGYKVVKDYGFNGGVMNISERVEKGQQAGYLAIYHANGKLRETIRSD